MQKKHTKPITVNQTIMDTVRNEKPETVEQLIKLVQQRFSLPEREIRKLILNLQNKGKLVFREQVIHQSTYKAYIFSAKAAWYWTIIALAITASVFIIPENPSPSVHITYVLGSLFVLFLPGFCLIKALFPSKELDNIERMALSIGTSLALFPITGLLLHYTPWGIRTIPVTLSLLALTMTLATAAVVREHEAVERNLVKKTENKANLPKNL